MLLLFVVAASAAFCAAAVPAAGGYDCYHSHYLHVSSVLVIVYMLLVLWGLQNKCINENPQKTSSESKANKRHIGQSLLLVAIAV